MLSVVHAVTGTVIDAQFADSAANVSPITKEADAQAVYTRNDQGTCPSVLQAVQPVRKRHAAVGGLILADSQTNHCSSKATGGDSEFYRIGRSFYALIRHHVPLPLISPIHQHDFFVCAIPHRNVRETSGYGRRVPVPGMRPYPQRPGYGLDACQRYLGGWP